MVIYVLDIGDPHYKMDTTYREAKGDAYCVCSCGYKGPAREVNDKVDKRSEIETDIENHLRLADGPRIRAAWTRYDSHVTTARIHDAYWPCKLWGWVVSDEWESEYIPLWNATELEIRLHTTDLGPIKGPPPTLTAAVLDLP